MPKSKLKMSIETPKNQCDAPRLQVGASRYLRLIPQNASLDTAYRAERPRDTPVNKHQQQTYPIIFDWFKSLEPVQANTNIFFYNPLFESKGNKLINN